MKYLFYLTLLFYLTRFFYQVFSFLKHLCVQPYGFTLQCRNCDKIYKYPTECGISFNNVHTYKVSGIVLEITTGVNNSEKC